MYCFPTVFDFDRELRSPRGSIVVRLVESLTRYAVVTAGCSCIKYEKIVSSDFY